LGIKFKILNQNIPLAEKLRPKTLDEVLGQEHLTGKNGTIRKMLENDTLNSLIFGDLQEQEKLLWQKLFLKIREGNFLNFLPFLAV
jgi:putative ATPase